MILIKSNLQGNFKVSFSLKNITIIHVNNYPIIYFRFVTQIVDQTTLVEMQSTKFECQLAPVGDPNMKVEWFLNGKPLPYSKFLLQTYIFINSSFIL